jgi:signal transduction histidine kinase/DNA-binding CsgD family transcriptional regulator
MANRFTAMNPVPMPQRWLLAVLCAVFLLDVGLAVRETGGSLRSLGWTGGSEHLFGLVGAVVAAGCAVLAPLHSVRFAGIGAVAIGLPTAAVLLIEVADRGHHLVPVTLTQLAASMALIAFATRYGQPHTAMVSTAALVVANAAGLLDRAGRFDRDSVLVVAFLLVVSVATGLYFRARDRERTQSMRVAVSGAQQAERMALARELHDVVAHHVTGIVVQAQAARLVADREPEQAVAALERIADTGAEALTAMRMLVGSLRGAEPAGGGTAPARATSDLAADIRTMIEQFTGPAVRLELNLPDRLPDEMGRSVLRLVQESLTNVSKHAVDAGVVRVSVTCEGPELHVRVHDDGSARRGAPVGGSGGYGLVGMRERVELLGGYFKAGPASDGGWVVKASGFLLKDAGPTLLMEAVRAAARGDALVSPQVTVRLLRHFAHKGPSSDPADKPAEPLTERELDVVRAAARGLTNSEIGTELYLSLSTVKTHLAGAAAKLGARNRVEIAAWAWRTGLMS